MPAGGVDRLVAGVTLAGEVEHAAMTVSAGVRRGAAGPHIYLADALAPVPPWRAARADEVALLTAGPPAEGAWIGLVRLRPQVWTAFSELRECLQRAPSITVARALVDAPEWEELTRRVTLSLLPAMQDGGAAAAGAGLGVHPPGLATVTWDPSRGGFIGLHLDSWYGPNPPPERAAAPGRISINLGDEERYFLFCNLTIADMAKGLATLDPSDLIAGGAGALARAFLRRSSSYPIVRLRVRPGEAYIAPTENICHDGSTEGQSGWDLSLTIRGRFEGSTLAEFCERSLALERT
jgi:hypothetical protein